MSAGAKAGEVHANTQLGAAPGTVCCVSVAQPLQHQDLSSRRTRLAGPGSWPGYLARRALAAQGRLAPHGIGPSCAGLACGDIAHLGILFLILLAGLSWREDVIEARLRNKESFSINGYDVHYEQFEQRVLGDIVRVGPVLEVSKGKQVRKLRPYNVLYTSGQKTTEVAIWSGWFEDFYVIFSDVDWNGRVGLVGRVKPFMFWLWISMVTGCTGIAIAFVERWSGTG